MTHKNDNCLKRLYTTWCIGPLFYSWVKPFLFFFLWSEIVSESVMLDQIDKVVFLSPSAGTSQPLWFTHCSLSDLSARMKAVKSEISALPSLSAPSWELWPTVPKWLCVGPDQARLWRATWQPSLAFLKSSRPLLPASYLELSPTGASSHAMLPQSTAWSSTLLALLSLPWWW